VFASSRPVVARGFYDRQRELGDLARAVSSLEEGAPRWVAILGPRKIGKTSLVFELARRTGRPDLPFMVLDVARTQPISPELFRTYAARAVDAIVGTTSGAALERLLSRPERYRAAVMASANLAALPRDLLAEILELPTVPIDSRFVAYALDLPERLATAADRRVVVALDEFQEIATLAGKKLGDPFAVMRSVWQQHERCTYIVSGSGRSLLTEMVSDRRSPFFQHFAILEVGGFSHVDAVSFLEDASPPGRRIPGPLAARVVEVLGGHPFYLQLLGETLTAGEPPYDDRSLKEALQQLLFSRTGALSLYFQRELDRLIGNSTYLAAVLIALATGPHRLSDLASAIGASSGATASYVDRLRDTVVKRDDGTYALDDPTFGLWVTWRQPGGSTVPMSVLGNEGERAVAQAMSLLGFDLVYQSRGSRGAFDLLAVRGAEQLGVQVKRSSLPLRFRKSEWHRMEADAARLEWSWIVAAVNPDSEEVVFLDPARARRGREIRLGDAARIDNLVTWLAAG
jgi:hypothetical protein